MWALFIISTTVDFNEPKVTRYAEFETSLSCHIEQGIVEANFTQGETTLCTKLEDMDE